MVYLLHFDKPIGHVRHYAGATQEPYIASALERGEASVLQVPIVVAAREQGVDVIVARTWPTMYRTVDELPYRSNRRRLCPKCSNVEQSRRGQ